MANHRSEGRRRNSRVTSQSRRPVQARGGGRDQRYRSTRNYRTIRGTDTGYNLRRNRVNFSGRQGGLIGLVMDNPLFGVALLAGLVLAVVILFSAVSCVRGCVTDRLSSRGNEVSEQDSRIAAGLSSNLAAQLSAALDRGNQMSEIAAHASDYDERLIELALEESDAVDFVAAYPTMEHEGSSYDAEVTAGFFVPLFCWDVRWGAVDFADGPLAVTGSGPTSLFMAYMGLLGSADRTPSDIAQLISENDATDKDLGMSFAFLDDGGVRALNLSVEDSELSGEALSTLMEAGTVALVCVGDETEFGSHAHWLLVPAENSDGTVSVFDPTSPTVSTRAGATSTVANAADAIYALRAAESDTIDADSSGSDET